MEPRGLLDEATRRLQRPPGPGAPRQAAVRRVVSDAYYAIFHFLSQQAARSMIGTTTTQPTAARRSLLRRCLNHVDLGDLCKSIAGGTLPKLLEAVEAAGGETQRISQALMPFAGTVRDLQTMRHRADYDYVERISLAEAETAIRRADKFLDDWADLDKDDVRFFLVLDALWPTLRKR